MPSRSYEHRLYLVLCVGCRMHVLYADETDCDFYFGLTTTFLTRRVRIPISAVHQIFPRYPASRIAHGSDTVPVLSAYEYILILNNGN
jgi:hypothetical protein